MKKKLTVLAVLALCLGLAATGTWAYFTAQKQVHHRQGRHPPAGVGRR